MEPLIRVLNDPKNQSSPTLIHDTQKQLQVLQREPSAWQASLDLLQKEDAVMRFYGALTLTIKINADWNSDRIGKTADARNSLLEALVSSYVRLCREASGEKYVLQKLASTLATLYQKLGADWLSPVRHVLASLLQGQYVPPQHLPAISDLLTALTRCKVDEIAGILRFGVIIAEDVASRAPGSTLQQQLSLNCPDMIELLSHTLNGYCSNFIDKVAIYTHLTHGDFVILVQLALEALPNWTGLLKLHEAHAPKQESQAAHRHAVHCTTSALRVLNMEVDFVAGWALNALVMIQTLSPKLLLNADPGFPRSLITSPASQQWVSALTSGDFSSEASLAFVDLLEAIMLQVDTTSTDYIHSDRYPDVVRLLLTLMRCEGTAGVEDVVCSRILETISTIVEGHTDWDPDPMAEEFLKQFVGQVSEACLEKAKLPEEEMNYATRTWDKDDRITFQDFRFDVQDFLQSAFGVVGTPLLEAIAGRVTSTTDWRDFEGSLYCLVAFADTMSSEPQLYDSVIASVLDGPHFREVIHSQQVPDMARKTCIKFISEMTAYFKRHPNLMQILNFLFSALHQPASAAIASRAIYTLCDSQRSVLTAALPGFLASLTTISDLRGMERHRIYGAVAAVVQSIKDDSGKVQPLLDILDLLAKEVQLTEATTADEDSFVAQNTDLLQTLAAIGRGLRAPDDTPIDLEDSAPRNVDFWLSGAGSIVQERTLEVYQRVVERVGSRAGSDFVEASCDFVRSGFTETHPSPFKFSSRISVDLVTQNITVSSPNIDVVMASAASLLAAASREEFRAEFPRLLQPVLVGMQQFLNSPDRAQSIRESSYPSASLDFMSRSFPRWGSNLLDLDEAQDALAICIELALLVVAEPDTLPRRSAAHFFGAFVDLSKAGKLPQDGPAHQNMAVIGERYQPRILASILRLIGGECARSELEVFAEQIRRYVHSQPILFKNVGREAMKEENRVLSEKALDSTTLDLRERFISQVDMLRGARKTTEVVKDFWVTCRGSDFGYIA